MKFGLFSSGSTIGWNAVALISSLRTLSGYEHSGKLFYVTFLLSEFLVVLGG